VFEELFVITGQGAPVSARAVYILLFLLRQIQVVVRWSEFETKDRIVASPCDSVSSISATHRLMLRGHISYLCVRH